VTGLPPAGSAVTIRGVEAAYARPAILTAFDLHVERGEYVGLVGPSGAGKTTVLRLLTGGVEVRRGDVEVLGTRVTRGRPPRGVGYVPQLGSVDWDFPLTVREVVLLGDAASSASVPWFAGDERRRADGLLDRLGISELATRPIAELSGGQRQRMFLARALARRSELLLLDEPTSGVDLATRAEVLRLLGEMHHEGLTVVITTHDLNFVAAHLPRIVCVNRTVVADGSPDDVLTEDVLTRTYGPGLRIVRDPDGRPVVADAAPIPLHSGTDHLLGVGPSRTERARTEPAREEAGIP
jgi:zinc/manganese transport system ATP-binding protein